MLPLPKGEGRGEGKETVRGSETFPFIIDHHMSLVFLATSLLFCACCSFSKAGDTAFDSLAFVPETGQGSQVAVENHTNLNWTRVAFRPQLTNGFPEEIKPLRIFPAPAAQVSGLAVAGEDLWVASRETRRIYRLQAGTGIVQDSFATPGERPVGLCWDGHVLWHTDGQSRELFALDPSGKVLKRFPLPFEPAAVLCSTSNVLVSAWDKDQFHRIDADTGKLLSTERAPDDHLTGLTRVGRYLWCSRGDEVICFDPERHLPVCGFNAAFAGACALAGLASDGETLWLANSASNQLVQIRRPVHGQWVGGSGRVRRAGFEIVYRNTSPQPIESFSILQHIPFLEMPGQRYLALEIEPAARAFFRDDLGNVVAALDFGRLAAGESVRCQVSTTMWVADRRLVIDPDLLNGKALSSEQRAYTQPFHPIPGEDSVEVQAFVDKAVSGETNPYWRVRKAHDALCGAIYYREPADESVPGVLRQGYGVCRNYSAVMESFGRLLGVPVLNAWAPRHETCFLMLPGVSPAVLEVTANDSGPDPATVWRRSRWFLGTSADEITTGVRGYAMHNRLSLDGVSYAYQWHYWAPVSTKGIRHEGWWTITSSRTGKARRL